jgi:hypothetical protein
MAVRELLFELAGQALLNLVEAGEERDRYEEDNGALAMADFELRSLLVLGFGEKAEGLLLGQR